MGDSEIELTDRDVVRVLQCTGDLTRLDRAVITKTDRERFASNIRSRTHKKRDADALMKEFMDFHDSAGPIPPDLLQYVRDSFADYLNGTTLGAAFGTTLPTGKPPTDTTKSLNLAVEMWNKRVVERKSYQEAVNSIAGTFYEVCNQDRKDKSSRKVVGDAWAKYMDDGLVYFRAVVSLSEEQEARVTEILKNAKK